jgi:hypothetical protein
MTLNRIVIRTGTVLTVMGIAAVIAANQAPIDLGSPNMLPRIVPARPHDGAFRFCRLRVHSSSEGDGDGWWVDSPRAVVNLSIRLAELTRSHVSFDAINDPLHQVVALTDSELFSCGFVMMSEPGGTYFSRDEAKALRTYLLKGGFLWVDDFWGPYRVGVVDSATRRGLAAGDYPIFDVPMRHSIFHMLFDIGSAPDSEHWTVDPRASDVRAWR